MNTQITLDRLSELKLEGMSKAYKAPLEMPVQNQPSLNQFMAPLGEGLVSGRPARKSVVLRENLFSYCVC